MASVRVSAQVDESKPAITLNWILENNEINYVIHRRVLGSTNWGVSLATLTGSVSSFRDTTVVRGVAYEYRVRRLGMNINASGFLTGGIRVPALPPKKSILILVEGRIKDSLQNELSRLISDLENESWHVLREDVPQNYTAIQVRNNIRNLRNSVPGLTTVFIVGHVAVPYSGNTPWDGHTPDHTGAWPADTYYADIDGNWTDVSVNNNGPARNQNKNIPGDGKFDQSLLPSDADLEVGRLDFFDMPVMGISEIQLLKKYLNKNHLFRTAQIRANHKAVVMDNFNFQGEYFGSTGFKNFVPFFGPDSVINGNYRNSLLTESHLWSYGCGGGTYTSAGGISTSANMAVDSLRGIFTLLFGSYHGDWDSQNNFMRSSLGSGTILTCAWAGRPGWQFHHMALGFNIGFSARTSMNNNGTQYEVSPTGLRGTHMALLGDPSLNMYPISGPKNLIILEETGQVNLNWTASADATEGYNVYRKSGSELYYKIVASDIKDTLYIDRCLPLDSTFDYLVTATKLITNASGSFYMNSPGARNSITINKDHQTKSDLDFVLDYEFVKANSRSTNYNTLIWNLNDYQSSDSAIDYRIDCEVDGAANLQLIASGPCNSDTTEVKLDYLCSTPRLRASRIDPPILCFGDSTIIYLDTIDGAGPFEFEWSQGESKLSYSSKVVGKVSVLISSSKNTKASFEFDLPSFDALVIDSIQVLGEIPGGQRGKLLSVGSSGGVPPYTYRITGNFDPENLAAGEYELVLTDANGCQTKQKFVIPLRVSTKNYLEHTSTLYPNPAQNELWVRIKGFETRDINFRIFDATGKTIANTYTKQLDQNQYSINIEQLMPGAYILSITDGKKQEKLLFVKSLR
ncbi:MAG: T9SS type A sorting domain-containing protein [Saprospiraceae bacterium]|nr:T9SS type A sorting domain-containing protein [Saprospiraceae bacterium]